MARLVNLRGSTQRIVQQDVAALSPAIDLPVTFAVEARVMHTTNKVKAMSRTTDAELTKVPLFANLSRKQLRWAAQLTAPLDLPAGQVLARQGSVGAEFFVVLEGIVEVVRSAELIATRGAGSPLGEIALLGARPRTATLIAQTPVRVCVASQREFSGLLAEVPEISQRLRAVMAERLAA